MDSINLGLDTDGNNSRKSINEAEPGEWITGDTPEKLCRVNDNMAAAIIESLLDGHHIPVLKKWRNGGDIAMLYLGASSTAIDIYVPSKLLAKAKALLAEAAESPGADGAPDGFDEPAADYRKKMQARAQRFLLVFVGVPAIIILLAILWAVFGGV